MAKKDRMLAKRKSGFLATLWPEGLSKLSFERPRRLIERLKLPSKPAEDETSSISEIEREIDRELAVAVATHALRVAP